MACLISVMASSDTQTLEHVIGILRLICDREDLQDIIFKSGAVHAFTPLLASMQSGQLSSQMQVLSIIQVLVVEDRDGHYKRELIGSGLVNCLMRYFSLPTQDSMSITSTALQIAQLLLQTDEGIYIHSLVHSLVHSLIHSFTHSLVTESRNRVLSELISGLGMLINLLSSNLPDHVKDQALFLLSELANSSDASLQWITENNGIGSIASMLPMPSEQGKIGVQEERITVTFDIISRLAASSGKLYLLARSPWLALRLTHSHTHTLSLIRYRT